MFNLRKIQRYRLGTQFDQRGQTEFFICTAAHPARVNQSQTVHVSQFPSLGFQPPEAKLALSNRAALVF